MTPETTPAPAPTAAPAAPAAPARSYGRLHFYVFCGMLALAFVGMGLTQWSNKGAWEYWAFTLVVFALVSTWLSWRGARRNGEPIWPAVRRQVFHWLGTFLIFNVVFLMQMKGIVDRESAAKMSIVALALSCWQAGVHFDWSFLLLGVVLVVMQLALAFLETVQVWVVTIPIALVLAWLYFKRKFARPKAS